tara:strand:+ start:145 stop:570 length:426 start_codon:yes stop_codon:yes gene_type:complete
MDTRERIKHHEGFSPTVYEDTLGYKTVGYGHLVTSRDDFVTGELYSPEQLEGVFEEDYATAVENAHDILEDEGITLEPTVESVLIEMAFQLGSPRLKKFIKFIAALKEKNYSTAADEMMDSRWASQTPSRAHELSEIIRNI